MAKWTQTNKRWNQENKFHKLKIKENLTFHYQEINVLVLDYFLKNF